MPSYEGTSKNITRRDYLTPFYRNGFMDNFQKKFG